MPIPSSRSRLPIGLVLLVVAVLFGASHSHAAEARVAVATNFAEVAERLADEFAGSGEHRVTLITGSTGKLYAQILQGAPFDVLLAADRRRPTLLEREGRAAAGSRFTYAVGRLVLWSPDVTRIVADGSNTLAAGGFRRLAMANPELAPYGAAARETLIALGLLDRLRDRTVYGENVGQAFTLVATGNAELGFVALSQLAARDGDRAGSQWLVPARLHSPIRQDAVLLARGSTNPAARAFLAFLRGDAALRTLEAFGYEAE